MQKRFKRLSQYIIINKSFRKLAFHLYLNSRTEFLINILPNPNYLLISVQGKGLKWSMRLKNTRTRFWGPTLKSSLLNFFRIFKWKRIYPYIQNYQKLCFVEFLRSLLLVLRYFFNEFATVTRVVSKIFDCVRTFANLN